MEELKNEALSFLPSKRLDLYEVAVMGHSEAKTYIIYRWHDA